MQKHTMLHPNRLRELAQKAGYTWIDLAEDTHISVSTLRRWADGNVVIPRKDRPILAQVIGCEIDDLAPLNDLDKQPTPNNDSVISGGGAQLLYLQEEERIVGIMYGKNIKSERASLCNLASPNALRLIQCASIDGFAVDDLITLTQSNGFKGWNRDEIFITKRTEPMAIPEDIEALRQEKLSAIQKNFTNSSHYRLIAYTPAFSDRQGLDVILAPIGFHDYYTLIPFLDRPALSGGISIREKYGPMAFTYTERATCPVPAPVALHNVVVTKDRQIVFMKRSNSVAFYPLHWSASCEETMDSPGLSPKGNTRSGDKDFFSCVIRGMEEELGISTDAIDTIKVLSLNIEYLLMAVAVVAVVRVHLTASELKSHWLIQAPDRNEASKFETVPIEPSAIIDKLFSGDVLWHPTSRMRLIQFLFHEYGVKEITALIERN